MGCNNKISPLTIQGLTVAYNNKPAIWELDYEAPVGGLVAVLGPNGAGKSTMIKSILGLVPKLNGEIRVFGQRYNKRRGNIAYVPQRSSVDWDFPISAGEVVAMGLYRKIGWARRVREIHRETALHYLSRVKMRELADRQIGQLSGGQQQRVFLARALAQEANLYLMDEPFSGVDATTEQTIIDVMREVTANGATVICVHHDLHTVSNYFNYALILNIRAIASGTIDEVLTKQNLEAAYGEGLANAKTTFEMKPPTNDE